MSELTETHIESSDDELPEEIGFDASKSAALKSVKDALEAVKRSVSESTDFRHRAHELMRCKHFCFSLCFQRKKPTEGEAKKETTAVSRTKGQSSGWLIHYYYQGMFIRFAINCIVYINQNINVIYVVLQKRKLLPQELLEEFDTKPQK